MSSAHRHPLWALEETWHWLGMGKHTHTRFGDLVGDIFHLCHWRKPRTLAWVLLKGVLPLKSTEECWNVCLHLLQRTVRDRDSKNHICTMLLPQNFGEHKAKKRNCKDFYHWTYSTTTKHFSKQYRKLINQISISLPVKFIRITFSSLIKPQG